MGNQHFKCTNDYSNNVLRSVLDIFMEIEDLEKIIFNHGPFLNQIKLILLSVEKQQIIDFGPARKII